MKTQIFVSGTMWGTNHFPSENAAVRYYTPQYNEWARQYVLDAIADKSIIIGRPPLKTGEEAFLDEDERYFIVQK